MVLLGDGQRLGSVFLINVPIVIIGLIGIIRVVPETRNPHPQRLDIPGLVMSFLGLVLLVYGIIHASETRSFLAPSVWTPMLIGGARASPVPHAGGAQRPPQLRRRTVPQPGYAVSLSAVSLVFFAMSGVTFTCRSTCSSSATSHPARRAVLSAVRRRTVVSATAAPGW